MKSFLFLSMFALTACGASAGDAFGVGPTATGPGCALAVQKTSADPAQCVSDGKVPIYSNRFSATCEASGVVSGAVAYSGQTPTDPSATPSSPSDAPPSAMTVSCGQSDCAVDQVAVVDPTPGASGGSGSVICAAAPPTCPDGQSPQFVFSSSTWECTDCSVVITYGGTYGNYSRCASAPAISCPSGQVPTWVYEDEKWECQDTCDNGQYDQHLVSGSTVCVPC